MANGLRSSTYTSFIEPVKSRKNLFLQSNAMTKRLLIQGNKVYGVIASVNGKDQIFYADKEVIVSSGAIGSPQILMLSGIGPKDELTKHAIPLVKDLPVGENLHDHLGVPLIFKDKRGVSYESDYNLTSGLYLGRVFLSYILVLYLWIRPSYLQPR